MTTMDRDHGEPDRAPPRVSQAAADTLLVVARDSIRHGLDHGRPLAVLPEEYPEELRKLGATFVTLQIGGRLRGCVGVFEARRPLVVDVAENAYAAAFRDPRFPALGEDEFPHLEIHLSVLGVPVPMSVESEEELLRELRPGVDGLILEDGTYRSLFLPQVWESLPDPADFVGHLKLKARLSVDHWSPEIRFRRFVVDEFG